MKKQIKNIIKILACWALFILFLALISHASAADVTPLTAQDLSAAALSANSPELSATAWSEKLFGDIALNPVKMIGSPNTILGEVLVIVNICLMAMASVWMTWTVVKGSMMTAHDGQFIGKSMHSAWVPFRLVVGTASLVPFFKGLCFAQLIMLGAIQMSIGAGNLAWRAAVKYVYAGNMVVNPTRATSNSDLTQNLFNSLLCVHSLNYGLVKMTYEPSYKNSIVGSQWNFGSTTSGTSGSQGTECGSFEMPAAGTTNLSSQNSAQRIASFQNLLTSLDSEAERIAKGEFMSVTDPQNNPPPQVDKTYLAQASAASYAELTSITESLTKQANIGEHKGELLNGAQTAAQTQGFATAGAWFFGLASKNKVASEAISQTVKLGKPALLPSDTIFVGHEDIYAKTSNLTLSSPVQNGDVKYDYSNESYALKAIKSAICGDASPKTASGVNLTLGQCIVNKTINSSDQADQTALIRIAELGNSITALGAASLTALGAAQGALDGADQTIIKKAANLVGGGIAIGALAGSIGIWLETLKEATKVLLFFGLIAGTYIPLIPAIIWIMRMVTICAVWVEAVVSASVWAFSHLETEGEGMGGRSGHGYMFLFNVLLNPMLSVLGLVLGTVLLDVMTSFVLNLYPDMIANSAGDSWTGLLSIMAYLVIFVLINLSLVNLCMQLINTVPDNVIDWVGGRVGGGLGKGGEDTVGASIKNAMNGGGWIPKGGNGNSGSGGNSGSDKTKATVD